MPDIDDAHISVRFKHGIHTVFLFVDALAPFSTVTAELLETLRERYPAGLTTSIDPHKTTPVPEDAKLAYAVLTIPDNPSRGWKRLKLGEEETHSPTKAGLKNTAMVAFAIVDGEDGEDGEDEEVVFEVEWPREDEEMYDQG